MLRPVVFEVTSLAPSCEVGVPVVGGVVVTVRGRQDDAGAPDAGEAGGDVDDGDGAVGRAPDVRGVVPPPAVAGVIDEPAMRAPARLASAPGPAKADHGRQLRPVDGVKEAVFAPDRHGGPVMPSRAAKA